jgi:hypothetical protein
MEKSRLVPWYWGWGHWNSYNTTSENAQMGGSRRGIRYFSGSSSILLVEVCVSRTLRKDT